MPAPEFPTDATLGAWLSMRARLLSMRRLVVLVAAGAPAALAVALWRPDGWPVFLGISTCIAAFGLWAATERRVAELPVPLVWPKVRLPRSGEHPASTWSVGWHALHAIAALVGFLGAMLAVFGLMFGVLGTWIS